MSQTDPPADRPQDPGRARSDADADDGEIIEVEVVEEIDIEVIETTAVHQPFTMPDDGEGEDWGGDDSGDDPLAALFGGGGGAGGGLDLGSLMEQAAAMQSQLVEAQARAAETVIEGAAGGGVVKVSVTGGWEFQSVTIDPSAVDPNDVEMLQDLVLAALHHAAQQVAELQQSAVDLGGLDIGDLFGGG